jgi:hypothetical protein
MIADPSGGVTIVGTYGYGAVDLGGAITPVPNAADAFLLRLDASGGYVRFKAVDANGDQYGSTLCGSNVDLQAGFKLTDQVNFGNGLLTTSAGTNGAFNAAVVGFDSSFGALERSQFLGSQMVLVKQVATGTAGSVVSFGDYNNEIIFNGGSSQTRSGGKPGIFLSRTSHLSAPDILRHTICDESTACIARAVATNAATGEALAGGRFTGNIAFPGGGMVVASDDDAFLMKLDADLNLQWVVALGGAGVQETIAIASIPGTSDYVATGSFAGTFAAPGLMPVTANGDIDIFVVRIDGAGRLVWSKTFGGPGRDIVSAITADAEGNVFFAGRFLGPNAVLGGAPLVNADTKGLGTSDAFVAWLDGSGNHVYSTRFGDAADDDVSSIAMDAAKNVFIAGSFQGEIGFDANASPLHARGRLDMFVAKFARLTQ